MNGGNFSFVNKKNLTHWSASQELGLQKSVNEGDGKIRKENDLNSAIV